MKRVYLLCLLFVGICASAQQLTPLSIQLAELNLDSLRDAYLAQPTMYRASLEVVEQELEQNAQQIKVAKEQLKAEQNIAKEVAKTIKDGLKMLAAAKKQQASEEKELAALIKLWDAQQKKTAKQDLLNQPTKDVYTTLCAQQKQVLDQLVQDLKAQNKTLTESEEQLKSMQLTWQTFSQSIEKKAFELAQLEVSYQTKKEMLKAEQKAAKKL